jgi:hypothetical protein
MARFCKGACSCGTGALERRDRPPKEAANRGELTENEGQSGLELNMAK